MQVTMTLIGHLYLLLIGKKRKSLVVHHWVCSKTSCFIIDRNVNWWSSGVRGGDNLTKCIKISSTYSLWPKKSHISNLSHKHICPQGKLHIPWLEVILSETAKYWHKGTCCRQNTTKLQWGWGEKRREPHDSLRSKVTKVQSCVHGGCYFLNIHMKEQEMNGTDTDNQGDLGPTGCFNKNCQVYSKNPSPGPEAKGWLSRGECRHRSPPLRGSNANSYLHTKSCSQMLRKLGESPQSLVSVQ